MLMRGWRGKMGLEWLRGLGVNKLALGARPRWKSRVGIDKEDSCCMMEKFC